MEHIQLKARIDGGSYSQAITVNQAVAHAEHPRILTAMKNLTSVKVFKNQTRGYCHAGSSKIQPQNSACANFATGDCGGDRAALYFYVHEMKKNATHVT